MPTHQHFSASTPRIMIFDSGVGGLSIANAIQHKFPDLSLIYLSDNAAFPYGTKSAEFLVSRVEQVLSASLAKYPADIIVIACNTASTVALPHIRSHFTVPIVGVVPAIKPAAAITQTGTIGLLATPGTISRTYTQQLIQDYASHCTIIKVGSSRLVQIAEEKLRGLPVSQDELLAITAPFRASEGPVNMDTVVLACTHFPLLKPELEATAACAWQWIDSGDAIARRVGSLLQKPEHNSNNAPSVSNIALTTAPVREIEALLPSLRQFGFLDVNQLHLPA